MVLKGQIYLLKGTLYSHYHIKDKQCHRSHEVILMIRLACITTFDHMEELLPHCNVFGSLTIQLNTDSLYFFVLSFRISLVEIHLIELKKCN